MDQCATTHLLFAFSNDNLFVKLVDGVEATNMLNMLVSRLARTRAEGLLRFEGGHDMRDEDERCSREVGEVCVSSG